MANKATKIFFYEWQETSHGYTSTHIRMYSGDITKIADLIAGCVDNAAGYGTAEAAKQMLREYSALRSQGVTHVVGSDHYGINVIARMQHSQDHDGFCGARFDLGYDFSVQVKGVAFVQKLAKRANHRAESFTPASLVSMLETIGAIRVNAEGRHRTIGKAA